MPSHLAGFYEYTATVARMPQHERAAGQFVVHRLRRPVIGGRAFHEFRYAISAPAPGGAPVMYTLRQSRSLIVGALTPCCSFKMARAAAFHPA